MESNLRAENRRLINFDFDHKISIFALKNSKNNPVYRSFRKVPRGTQLEFKIIRTMSYDHVQLGAYCEEVENLKLTADEDMTYQAVVYNWKEE